MQLLKTAGELGVDLRELETPQDTWDDNTNVHLDERCPHMRRYKNEVKHQRRSILDVEVCTRCMESGSLDKDYRRRYVQALNVARLHDTIERVKVLKEAQYKAYKELQDRSARLRKSNDPSKLVQDLLKDADALIQGLVDPKGKQEAALAWVLTDIIGGNKDYPGSIITDPGEYAELFPRGAEPMLNRVTRRWRNTKRTDDPRESVLKDAQEAMGRDDQEVKDLVVRTFDRLDAAYETYTTKDSLQVGLVRVLKKKANLDGPVGLVLEAYTVHEGEGGLVMLAPSLVYKWLYEKMRWPISTAAPADTDDVDTYEIALTLWLGAPEGGKLQNGTSALSAARVI